jgi:hypothetical protein
VVLLRYLDVCLVLATAPFVPLAGLPLLGYLIAAAAWLLTRLGTTYIQERALRISDHKMRAGVQVAGMMGRIWTVALAIIVARFAGDKSDGIMAAVVMLAAFTVYFVMSFFTRDAVVAGGSGGAAPPGRPTTS